MNQDEIDALIARNDVRMAQADRSRDGLVPGEARGNGSDGYPRCCPRCERRTDDAYGDGLWSGPTYDAQTRRWFTCRLCGHQISPDIEAQRWLPKT
jgi:hypothetical protein